MRIFVPEREKQKERYFGNEPVFSEDVNDFAGRVGFCVLGPSDEPINFEKKPIRLAFLKSGDTLPGKEEPSWVDTTSGSGVLYSLEGNGTSPSMPLLTRGSRPVEVMLGVDCMVVICRVLVITCWQLGQKAWSHIDKPASISVCHRRPILSPLTICRLGQSTTK
jgi:hypothetical protein